MYNVNATTIMTALSTAAQTAATKARKAGDAVEKFGAHVHVITLVVHNGMCQLLRLTLAAIKLAVALYVLWSLATIEPGSITPLEFLKQMGSDIFGAAHWFLWNVREGMISSLYALESGLVNARCQIVAPVAEVLNRISSILA